MTPKTLKGGMIGAGTWSDNQLRAWQSVKGAKIVALCDQQFERCEKLAQIYSIGNCYSDVHTMLREMDLDFIDVCTRPMSHATLIQAGVDAGLDVLCQKPFCQTLPEAIEVAQYAQSKNVRLMINENFRWQGWYRQIKTILDTGRIGTPFSAILLSRQSVTMPAFQHSQTYFQDMPQLIVYEMGIHYLDAMRFLFGKPTTIYARLHKINPKIAGEDVEHIVLTYPYLTTTIHHSWASLPVLDVDYAKSDSGLPSPPRIEIEGTNGTLVLKANGVLTLITYDGEKETWTFNPDERLLARTSSQQHFIDCLKNDVEFETGADDYLHTMATVYATYQSSESNQVVRLTEFP